MKFNRFLNKLFGFENPKPVLIIASLLLFSQCDKNPVGYHEETSAQDEIELIQDDQRNDIFQQEIFKIPPGKKEKFIVLFENRAEPRFIREAGGNVRYSYDIIPAVAVSLTQEALNNIESFDRVLRIERDGEIHALDTELDNSWGVQRIGSGSASNKGSGVKIGIVDSGIDYNHSDLDGNYGGGYDFMNNDSDPMDDHGHGTHVAGIIAAEDNNSGVVGVAPEARIYALKVLNSSGSGNWSNVIAALDWARNNGLRIVNHSYGSSSYPGQTVEDAFSSASSAGIINVAAAGNSGSDVEYPGKFSSVIAVAATDYFNNRASFSSIGSEVELAAPGVSINSTNLGGGYSKKSGTSTAAPHVAGALALAIVAGNGNPRGTLSSTADDLEPAGKDNQFGYGMVNAEAASSGSGSTPPPAPNTAPTVTITQPSSGSTFNTGTEITFSGTASDPENGNLSSFILWISSVDGYFATGSTVSKVLSTGNHVITAKAVDAAGLPGSTTINVSIQTPNTAPTLAISQPGNGSSFTSGSTINFIGSANDSEDGDLSSQINWSSNLSGQLGTGSSITTALSNGSHLVTAQVNDSKGLSATSQINVTIESAPDPPAPPPIQNTPPTVTIDQPLNGASFKAGETIVLKGSAEDTESGNLSSFILWNSSADGFLGTGSTLNVNLSVVEHTITATVTDVGNLSSSFNISISVEEEDDTDPAPPSPPPIQNTPPTVTIDQPLNGASFKEGDIVTLKASAEDTESGNLSSFILWNSSADGFLGTGSTLNVNLSVANHTITATVTDVGNLSSSSNISITVEEEDDTDPTPPSPPPTQNTPPTVTIDQPLNGASFKAGDIVTLKASAEDTESGNLSNFILWDSNVDGFLGTGNTINVSFSNGEHIVTAKVTDSENASSTATITVIVIESETATPEPPLPVNYPPTIAIVDPVSTSDYSVNQQIIFSGSAQDPEDGDLSNSIQWSSNIDGYLGVGNTISSTLSNGKHTIEASVTDSENLSGSATISIKVSALEPDDGSNGNDDDSDPSDIVRNTQSIYVANFQHTLKQYGNISSEKIDHISVIEVRHDTNRNGLKDLEDEPLANVSVTILISSSDGQSWIMTGITGKDGLATITLGRVPLDTYNTSILEVSHSEYKSYDPAFGYETVSANYDLK
jgi:subtilisin